MESNLNKENWVPTMLSNDEMESNREFQFIKDENTSEISDDENEENEDANPRTCAYIIAFKNFMVYRIKCLYCDLHFSIKSWHRFVEHVQKEHKLSYDEDEDLSPVSKDIFPLIQPIENFALNLNIDQPFTENVVGIEDPFIKSEADCFSCSESNSISLLESQETEVQQLSTQCQSPVEQRMTTNEKINTSEELNAEKINTSEELIAEKINTSEELYAEINIETTEQSIVFSCIDLLRSYFRLWYTPKIKQASQEKTFTEFHFRFTQTNQLKLKRRDLFTSVQNIRDWYQNIFENEKFVSLKYPQSEYYLKLAEFLPDRLDGKSCEICKRVLPDNLQHYAHKQQEHSDLLTVQRDCDNFHKSGVPKTKINEYLRARYPITEPLNFECQVCYEKIPARWRLIHHIKTHINLRDYVCDVCGETFVKQCRLHKHRKRHFGEHKINCNICGEEFNGYTPLTTHRINYHRPIEGTIEEVAIKVKEKRKKTGRIPIGLYKQQIDPETQRKFFPCPFCNNRYFFPSGLNKHLNHYHKELFLSEKHLREKAIKDRRKNYCHQKRNKKINKNNSISSIA